MKLLQMEGNWIQVSTQMMDNHTRFITLEFIQDRRNEVML